MGISGFPGVPGKYGTHAASSLRCHGGTFHGCSHDQRTGDLRGTAAGVQWLLPPGGMKRSRRDDITMSTNATYTVTGMTCGHCVAAVTQEIRALAGVQDVALDLVAGGQSVLRVTSETPLSVDQVRAAVDEAGYALARAS